METSPQRSREEMTTATYLLSRIAERHGLETKTIEHGNQTFTIEVYQKGQKHWIFIASGETAEEAAKKIVARARKSGMY